MESNRYRVLNKNCDKVTSCAQLLKTKTLAAGSQCIENFFFIISTSISLIPAEWVWFTWYVLLFLNLLDSHLRLIKENIRKYFAAHQKFLKMFHDLLIYIFKIFHGPRKNLPAPSLIYLMYGALFRGVTSNHVGDFYCLKCFHS